MTKVWTILAFMILSAHIIEGQDIREREKLEAFKIGFFTKRLSLTASEAEKFWPVYNEFQTQRNKIQVEKQQLIRSFNQNQSGLSDAQITEIGDKLISAAQKEFELAVKFHKSLKEILPPAKVLRFYQAENQLRLVLLNELQNRQQERPGIKRQDPGELYDL